MADEAASSPRLIRIHLASGLDRAQRGARVLIGRRLIPAGTVIIVVLLRASAEPRFSAGVWMPVDRGQPAMIE